jgi:pyruvate, water dikinase
MSFFDRILSPLRRWLRPAPAPPPLSPEETQRLFMARYRWFRELLTANNTTLEAMAELETALRDGRTLSMTFIRSRCTLATVNVYKIITNLHHLADGRYQGLSPVFARLQEEIETLLAGNTGRAGGELALSIEQTGRHHADLTGEKMANLGEAGSLPGVRIPPGFVLTAVATSLFFQRNNLYPRINHIIQQMHIGNLEDLHRKSEAIQTLIRESPLPPEIERLLFDHFDRLAAEHPDLRLAVRSSALAEDLGQASFAGLYHTELDVDRDHLAAAYTAVLASKYTPRAISYRLAKGFRHEETEMCVGCLAMIEAKVSGVCYSRAIGGQGELLDIFAATGAPRPLSMAPVPPTIGNSNAPRPITSSSARNRAPHR